MAKLSWFIGLLFCVIVWVSINEIYCANELKWLINVLLSLLLCSFHDADFIEMTRVSYISLVLFHVMELLSKAALVLLVFFVSRNVREYLVFTHFYFSMQLLSKAALVLFDFFVSRHVREYLVFSHFYFSMHFYSCFWVLKWIEREFKHTLNFT